MKWKNMACGVAGGRTSKTVGQSTTSYTYNSLNQLTGKSGAESGSYSYDDRG
ncbi:MAG: hypothetical protein Q7T82_16195 [Armatimonadota bacterium]|nr:hypothetical protein [Armatimonadota bacterium]